MDTTDKHKEAVRIHGESGRIFPEMFFNRNEATIFKIEMEISKDQESRLFYHNRWTKKEDKLLMDGLKGME